MCINNKINVKIKFSSTNCTPGKSNLCILLYSAENYQKIRVIRDKLGMLIPKHSEVLKIRTKQCKYVKPSGIAKNML